MEIKRFKKFTAEQANTVITAFEDCADVWECSDELYHGEYGHFTEGQLSAIAYALIDAEHGKGSYLDNIRTLIANKTKKARS